MARLLFVAHDPGAARCLSAMVGPVRARGDGVSFLAKGPALDIWRGEGAQVWQSLDECLATDHQFDLAVTGTGFSDFERDLWPQLKALNVPVLAVIEGWTNFTLRFFPSGQVSHDQSVSVDGIAVVDDESRERVMGEPWCRVPVYVTGQPHLEAIAKRVRQQREVARVKAPLKARTVVFFSEPIDRDYGRERRGYDQFDIAAALVEGLAERLDVSLKIKPHPRESSEAWGAWLNGRGGAVCLAQETSEELLIACDGVIGMTSMVLVEARLAGIPGLSLQMGRVVCDNPLIDRLMPVVVKPDDLGMALTDFLAGMESGVRMGENAELKSIVVNATDRFLASIDRCLT